MAPPTNGDPGKFRQYTYPLSHFCPSLVAPHFHDYLVNSY